MAGKIGNTLVGGKTCWAHPALLDTFQEALQNHSHMLESDTTLNCIICIWIVNYRWRWNKGELTESVARTHLSSKILCPTPLRTWPDRDHHWCHHRDWPRCICFSCATSLLISKLRIKDTCSEEDFWLGRNETKEKTHTHTFLMFWAKKASLTASLSRVDRVGVLGHLE